RVRGKQELAKLGERLLGAGTAEMSDGALLNEVCASSRNGSGEGTSALILERIRSFVTGAGDTSQAQTFFPSVARREEIVSIMSRRFPAGRRALIERADRAMAGRFDLLGYNDLGFGSPIDWLLEPTTGRRAPLDHWSKIDYLDAAVAGDKKVTWELNRHSHFVTLGQAYWLTGDERYAEAFVLQASSWMDANPPKRGINWASSLELAFRSIAWLWALHLLSTSHHLTPKFVTRLLKCLVAHARHVESYLSYYFSPNTHLTGEALGLFYLGTGLPEFSRAGRWREMGLGILLEQLPIHVREDGVYFEQTSYYHRYTVDFYTHLVALARAGGLTLPAIVEERLALALDHLMWTRRPDGAWPLIGDDDGGQLIKLGVRRPDDFRDSLATGAALFGRGDWKQGAGDAAMETLWLLGPDGLARYDGLEAHLPAGQGHAFSDGGYYVMRDGWGEDASFAIVDCGPHGATSCGHAHADALAVEFAAARADWLVDPGTFTYTADASARDEFRASPAHNTVTVDGESQSVPDGPFSWKHVAATTAHDFIAEESFNYFEGSHNGYERLTDPVTHARAVLFLKRDARLSLPTYLLICDRMTARHCHDYAIRYHLPARSKAEVKDDRIEASHQSGPRLSISVFGHTEPKARIAQGAVSRVYGKRESAPVAVFEAAGERDQEFMSFILPLAAKNQAARVERQATNVSRAGAFTVSSEDSCDVVITGNGVSPVECKRLSAVATMAWARFAANRLVRACFVRGRKIEVKDAISFHSAETVKHCVIQVDGDGIDISIEGSTRFELKTNEPAGKVVINGTCLALKPDQIRASFSKRNAEWELAESDS
ncbi:MAG TPA: alginate lyase family protein, partial [Blastocatellia bacterium]|nr:alginate lyase family protein [Blastocatellia bacterium]